GVERALQPGVQSRTPDAGPRVSHRVNARRSGQLRDNLPVTLDAQFRRTQVDLLATLRPARVLGYNLPYKLAVPSCPDGVTPGRSRAAVLSLQCVQRDTVVNHCGPPGTATSRSPWHSSPKPRASPT